MMKLSVIVICHNNDGLNLVINAILKQRHKEDEIIIVNDNSDESHLSIIYQYKNEDNLIILNSDKIGNRSRNRNIGAMQAKNPFLLFVDGDMVLMDNCLQLIRMALSSGYVGAFGNIIQGGNTPEQMNLLTGFDYLEFLEGEPTIEDFYKHNLAYDKRAGLISQNIVSHSEWQYYYTGYCAATKQAFFDCGQFNESFTGWGAEDVEFGYRLEKQGDIKFLSGAYAYHISHQRDLYAIMQTNKKNLYYFLMQQTCHELEIFIAFHLNSDILETLGYIKNKMKTLELNANHILHTIGELSILPVSYKHPDGAIAYLNDKKSVVELGLMGVAMPFNNHQFDYVNLSTDIFCYPEVVFTRILQESYRVARQVRIYKYPQRVRIKYSSIVNALSASHSGMDRTNYNAYLINDFSFRDDGTYYIVTGGVAAKMPNLNIDNLPEVYKSRRSKNAYCLLFDFTDNLSDAQINEISAANSVTVRGVYRLGTHTKKKGPLRLSELIFGELQSLNSMFIYVIGKDDVIDKTDIWWSYKNRYNDKIVVYQQ